MLAVLPFQNLTGDAGQDYFSDGLTEEMITQLGSLNPHHLGVIARTSVMHYKNSQTQLDQIGRELGVQYVLEGSVRRDSDNVRITAQLIQVRDQTHVWTRQYDRQLTSLLVLQREIGQEIADQIQLALKEDIRTVPAQPPLSPQAYEAYDLCLKGQYFLNKRTIQGFQQAIKYFSAGHRQRCNLRSRLCRLGEFLCLDRRLHCAPASRVYRESAPGGGASAGDRRQIGRSSHRIGLDSPEL